MITRRTQNNTGIDETMDDDDNDKYYKTNGREKSFVKYNVRLMRTPLMFAGKYGRRRKKRQRGIEGENKKLIQ